MFLSYEALMKMLQLESALMVNAKQQFTPNLK